MCTYIIFFSARRYIAAAAIVELCTGSPKMAWNEEVSVHQMSCRKSENIF